MSRGRCSAQAPSAKRQPSSNPAHCQIVPHLVNEEDAEDQNGLLEGPLMRTNPERRTERDREEQKTVEPASLARLLAMKLHPSGLVWRRSYSYRQRQRKRRWRRERCR